jgi:hypothetical protein
VLRRAVRDGCEGGLLNLVNTIVASTAMNVFSPPPRQHRINSLKLFRFS